MEAISVPVDLLLRLCRSFLDMEGQGAVVRDPLLFVDLSIVIDSDRHVMGFRPNCRERTDDGAAAD